jgi:hypothetical protein
MNQRAPRGYEAPKVYGDIIDFACDLDRTFFEENRSRSYHERKYVPGEFWPLHSHVDRELIECVERVPLLIGVTEIEPGLRVHQPLFDLEALNALGATRRRLR